MPRKRDETMARIKESQNMKYWNQEKHPLVRAYRFGYHYGHLWLAPHLNPYPEGSKEREEWEKGWKAGAAFSVKQADIAREMVKNRPSRRVEGTLSRLNAKTST